jgi:hypothetical protein
MPRTSSARTSTSTTSTKTEATIAEARKKLAEAHKEGRHPSNKVPNCPTCEKAKNSNGGNGKATSTKANSKPQGNRRQSKPQPFRTVTVVTESYLAIQGLDDEDFDLATCPRCASLVPSGDKAETAHRNWHDEIDRIIEQLTEAVHGLRYRRNLWMSPWHENAAYLPP